ncbi:MAG TPA: MFS transporter [Bellilinea sp.]|nr:MFS transporter [Bellilinea sp.]
MNALRETFRPSITIPEIYRSNFNHLYWDIFWWGVLNGSTITFLSIYATRLGASTVQIGMLTAIPALMNLLFTFPAGSLAKRWSSIDSVKWGALITRSFYLGFILLPLFFTESTQIWVIILISLVMNIPGVLVAIQFNAEFAEVVPIEYRGHVSGTRNALYALASMVTLLISGRILSWVSMPLNYQIVFGIGLLGAMMSVYHLFHIRPLPGEKKPAEGRAETPKVPRFRTDVLTPAYKSMLGLVFLFQFALVVVGPIGPKHQIGTLHQSDSTISIGNAIFYVTLLVGSILFRSWSQRISFQRLTAIGMLITCGTLILFTYSYQNWIYYIHHTFAGIGWALINSGLINFVLQQIPESDRTAHLTWFNIVLNGAILLSGFVGPWLGNIFGIVSVLLGTVVLRLVVGILLYRWKPRSQPTVDEITA